MSYLITILIIRSILTSLVDPPGTEYSMSIKTINGNFENDCFLVVILT